MMVKEIIENNFDNGSKVAQENDAGTPPDQDAGTDLAGEGGTDEVNKHTPTIPPGIEQRPGSEEYVDITVDYVELISRAPKRVAKTLYRSDEAAYRAACGRTHALLVKKRKKPLRVPMGSDCLALMQFGRGMKIQRRDIIRRLGEEEGRREYVIFELDVATDKLESCARRTEAACEIWNNWLVTRNSKSSPLEEVLANPSGRRLWGEFLQNEIRRESTTPTEEVTKAPSSRESQTTGSPSTAPRSREGADDQLLVQADVGSTTSNEDASRLQRVTSEGDREETRDTNSIMLLLHMALERVTRHAGKGKADGSFGVSECTQFCKEWPRQRQLPTFLDRTLLEPIWSAVEQGAFDQGVTTALHRTRDVVRHEAQRLFFMRFLGSSEGQAFVIHVIQDGTIAPEEVQQSVRDLAEGASFDEDAQGFRRIIAHGDDWMHSRLVHTGVEQRVRVETVQPVLRALLEESTRHITDLRGKLSVIVQFVYSLAASRLQPFLRGALVRRRLPDVHSEMLFYAFLSAALEIQRVWRGHISRKRVYEVLVSFTSPSLVKFQAHVRGVLLRQRVAKKWAALLEGQAVEIQRVFRGYRSRGTVDTALREKLLAQKVGLYGWASLVLQRQARVWLARRVVAMKRVEVGLTSRVSELAAKLSSSDDSRSVSAVFGQIDKDYRNYERVIREMKAKEENMAITFVEKVLERRDMEIKDAWTRFVHTAVEYGSALKHRSYARRTHPQPVSQDEIILVSAARDRQVLTLMERYGIQKHAYTLPSAYLRSALPMHLILRYDGAVPKIGGDGAILLQKRPCAQGITPYSNRRAPDQRHASGTMSSVSCLYARSSLEDSVPSILSAKASATSATASADAAATAPSTGSPNCSSCISDTGFSNSEGRPLSRQSACGAINYDVFPSGDAKRLRLETRCSSAGERTWRSAGDIAEKYDVQPGPKDGDDGSIFAWQSTWDIKREVRGLGGDAGSRFPGSSIRQDMPSGLKEGVERVCAAAFLRGYVPEGLMPKGTGPEEAYQRYLELPPSLAKIRHEQLCSKASRPVAAFLRAGGYTTFEQLLPPSKLQHLFREAGAGVGEALAAMSLVREMKLDQDGSTGRGCGGDPRSNFFSPLSPFSRRGLTGSRRTTISKEGSGSNGVLEESMGGFAEEISCRGESCDMNRGASRGSCWPRAQGGEGSWVPTKKKKTPRISVEGLRFEGNNGGTGRMEGRWDPSRYTSRPEDWKRPPPSVIKQRWDDESKAFVPINNYSFDGLYRRHHPPELRHENGESRLNLDAGGTAVSRGKEDDLRPFEGGRHDKVEHEEGLSTADEASCPTPVTSPRFGPAGGDRDSYTRRTEETLGGGVGTSDDGMTESARDLYQYMINDSGSWGGVEDPIAIFLWRAAFYVVEHPSPPSQTELARAREKDLLAKGFKGNSKLARPVALAGKFKPSGLELQVAQASLAGRQVSMGPDAFREFVRELDATGGRQRRSPNTKMVSISRLYGASRVDPCRTLMQRRLEAAAMLADPFRVRLEADGVSSVRVLARVSVRAWGLPPPLVEETERMLGILVARTCASDHYDAHRGQRKHERHRAVVQRATGSSEGEFTSDHKRGTRQLRYRHRKREGANKRRHLGDFDPRFQRSPTDPFGRPPRLDHIQPSLHGPRQEMGMGRRGKTPGGEDDFPPGLWEGMAASQNQEGDHGTDDEEMETTIPTELRKPTLKMSPSFARGASIEGGKSKLNTAAEPEDENPSKATTREGEEIRERCERNKQEAVCRKSKDSISSLARTKNSMLGFTCRQQRECGAVFSRVPWLSVHETSHVTAPAYHRFRHAAQLLRDPPPLATEGAGAPAEKLRLRTVLPLNIQKELQSLQEKSKAQRQGILDGPGLSGTVAARAGVVLPERTVGGNTQSKNHGP